MSSNPTDEARVLEMAAALKGAAMSCLFVMTLLRSPLGPVSLSTYTAYDRGTIRRRGLSVLEKLGLATQVGRTDSWQLTDAGKQLGLFDVENLTIVGSCSSLINTTDQYVEPQLPQIEEEKFTLANSDHPDFDRLTTLLIGCGCPPDRARIAISNALSKNELPAWIELEIARWMAYGHAGRAKNINSLPHLIASRLETGTPCPPFQLPYDYHSPDAANIRRLEALMQQEHNAEQNAANALSDDIVSSGTTFSDNQKMDDPSKSVCIEVPNCTMTADQVWSATLGQLQLQMPRATFDAWMRQTKITHIEDGVFIISAHSRSAQEWLTNRLHDLVARTLSSVVGYSVQVRFVVDENDDMR